MYFIPFRFVILRIRETILLVVHHPARILDIKPMVQGTLASVCVWVWGLNFIHTHTGVCPSGHPPTGYTADVSVTEDGI